MTVIDTQAPAPVLFGLKELVEVFPSVAKSTVYRWNTPRNGGPQLPPPFRRVSETSMWTEGQVREFAAAKGLRLDEGAMALIRSAQTD